MFSHPLLSRRFIHRSAVRYMSQAVSKQFVGGHISQTQNYVRYRGATRKIVNFNTRMMCVNHLTYGANSHKVEIPRIGSDTNELNEYFIQLREVYKRLNIDQIIEAMYQIVIPSIELTNSTTQDSALKIFLNEHADIVEYLVHKINKNFKDSGDKHLKLFTMIGYLNYMINSENEQIEHKVPDNTKIEVIRVYNR